MSIGTGFDEYATGASERLSVGVAARLSRYLQVLTQAGKMGRERISSQEMAEFTNVNATQIRRDLSGFGKFGKRGVGYDVPLLIEEIRKILRTQGQYNMALFGAGRLGQAVARSAVFADHGFTIAAVFDIDPLKVGEPIGTTEVSHYSRLGAVLNEHSVTIAVLAVPASSAQRVAADVVAAGIRIIFNYSEALIQAPPDVTVHTSNPAAELLHALYFSLA
ncbi:MAG: redox-sensing transcriptional repressor Rex [Gaiellaceae bacterium]